MQEGSGLLIIPGGQAWQHREQAWPATYLERTHVHAAGPVIAGHFAHATGPSHVMAEAHPYATRSPVQHPLPVQQFWIVDDDFFLQLQHNTVVGRLSVSRCGESFPGRRLTGARQLSMHTAQLILPPPLIVAELCDNLSTSEGHILCRVCASGASDVASSPGPELLSAPCSPDGLLFASSAFRVSSDDQGAGASGGSTFPLSEVHARAERPKPTARTRGSQQTANNIFQFCSNGWGATTVGCHFR